MFLNAPMLLLCTLACLTTLQTNIYCGQAFVGSHCIGEHWNFYICVRFLDVELGIVGYIVGIFKTWGIVPSCSPSGCIYLSSHQHGVQGLITPMHKLHFTYIFFLPLAASLLTPNTGTFRTFQSTSSEAYWCLVCLAPVSYLQLVILMNQEQSSLKDSKPVVEG